MLKSSAVALFLTYASVATAQTYKTFTECWNGQHDTTERICQCYDKYKLTTGETVADPSILHYGKRYDVPICITLDEKASTANVAAKLAKLFPGDAYISKLIVLTRGSTSNDSPACSWYWDKNSNQSYLVFEYAKLPDLDALATQENTPEPVPVKKKNTSTPKQKKAVPPHQETPAKPAKPKIPIVSPDARPADHYGDCRIDFSFFKVDYSSFSGFWVSDSYPLEFSMIMDMLPKEKTFFLPFVPQQFSILDGEIGDRQGWEICYQKTVDYLQANVLKAGQLWEDFESEKGVKNGISYQKGTNSIYFQDNPIFMAKWTFTTDEVEGDHWGIVDRTADSRQPKTGDVRYFKAQSTVHTCNEYNIYEGNRRGGGHTSPQSTKEGCRYYVQRYCEAIKGNKLVYIASGSPTGLEWTWNGTSGVVPYPSCK